MNITPMRRFWISWTILVSTLGLVMVSSRAEAAKLIWQSVPGSTDILATGETFTDEVTFELGTFDARFKPTIANMGQWALQWSVIDRTTYNAANGFFASTVRFSDNEGPYAEGRQVYMWGTTGGSDPQWILATKNDWEFPSASLGFPLTWNIANASTVVVGKINGGGSPFLMRTAQVNGTLLDPSLSPEQWLEFFFSEGERADQEVGGLRADPDGDGRDNLMEMALGLDPRLAEPAEDVPYTVDLVEVSGFHYLRLVVLKPAIQQLRYKVEVSGDLGEWYSGPAYTTTLTDSVRVLSIRDRVAFETGQNRFIRLTVED